MSRVLAAIDCSAAASPVLSAASAVADLLGADIDAVHVRERLGHQLKRPLTRRAWTSGSSQVARSNGSSRRRDGRTWWRSCWGLARRRWGPSGGPRYNPHCDLQSQTGRRRATRLRGSGPAPPDPRPSRSRHGDCLGRGFHRRRSSHRRRRDRRRPRDDRARACHCSRISPSTKSKRGPTSSAVGTAITLRSASRCGSACPASGSLPLRRRCRPTPSSSPGASDWPRSARLWSDPSSSTAGSP